MPRGGKRPGAGAKKGSKYRPRVRLVSPDGAAPARLTAAERHEALKRQVSLCVAGGMKEEAIAAIMLITVGQLRLAFSHELQFGRDIVRAEELVRLESASAAGSVPAARELLKATIETSPPDPEGNRNSVPADRVTRLALAAMNGEIVDRG